MNVQNKDAGIQASRDRGFENNQLRGPSSQSSGNYRRWQFDPDICYDLKNPPPPTVGEKWFDALDWWGLGWGANVAVSIWATDLLEFGRLQPFNNKAASWMAETPAFKWLDKKYTPGTARGWAGSIAQLMMLMSGGFAVMAPIKWAEDNKKWWVQRFDGMFGKAEMNMSENEKQLRDARYEYLDHEPKQTWGTVLGGRVVSLAPVLGIHYAFAKEQNIVNAIAGRPVFSGLEKTVFSRVENFLYRTITGTSGLFAGETAKEARELGGLFPAAKQMHELSSGGFSGAKVSRNGSEKIYKILGEEAGALGRPFLEAANKRHNSPLNILDWFKEEIAVGKEYEIVKFPTKEPGWANGLKESVWEKGAQERLDAYVQEHVPDIEKVLRENYSQAKKRMPSAQKITQEATETAQLDFFMRKKGLVFEPANGTKRFKNFFNLGAIDGFYSGAVATATYFLAKAFAAGREEDQQEADCPEERRPVSYRAANSNAPTAANRNLSREARPSAKAVSEVADHDIIQEAAQVGVGAQ